MSREDNYEGVIFYLEVNIEIDFVLDLGIAIITKLKHWSFPRFIFTLIESKGCNASL